MMIVYVYSTLAGLVNQFDPPGDAKIGEWIVLGWRRRA